MDTKRIEVEVTKRLTAIIGGGAKAGGVEIVGAVHGDSKDLGTIELTIFAVDPAVTVEVKAVDVERAAGLLRELRRELGDYRHVCTEHGYFEEYDCPECKVPKLVEAANA